MRVQVRVIPTSAEVSCTGKKTPGGAGTHTGHTGHTGARGHTDHTDEPHNHPPKPNDTYPHENRDRHNVPVRAKDLHGQ